MPGRPGSRQRDRKVLAITASPGSPAIRACFRARKQIIVRLVESEVRRRGIELTAPVQCLVMGVFALFTGLSVENMIDLEEVDETLFGEMLGLLAASAMAHKS